MVTESQSPEKETLSKAQMPGEWYLSLSHAHTHKLAGGSRYFIAQSKVHLPGLGPH